MNFSTVIVPPELKRESSEDSFRSRSQSTDRDLRALHGISLNPFRTSPVSPPICYSYSFSPAMHNSHRDHISRCIDVLNFYAQSISSLDARDAIKEALGVFSTHFSEAFQLEEFAEMRDKMEHVQVDLVEVGSLLENRYPEMGDLQKKIQNLNASLHVLLENLVPRSPRQEVVGVVFKRITSETDDFA